MAGKELRQQLPEEPQLPQEIVGRIASQLIQDYKQALRDMPDNFERGGYQYTKKIQTDNGREDLEITKSPLHRKADDWMLEAVSLSAGVNRESGGFTSGSIQDLKVDQEMRLDYYPIPTNTPTAIKRVKDFLTTNFGDK